ncbi:B3 domain-containing protein Os03g0622200-like [Triticum dicoccoides]|uniref:B3 domain-containing protein Os03g0622200-like n=1 Tax=Triticum dicoccoides TaxID=85692 RepID=UPI00188EEA35|nr:B3 domain-containing protein Os03g0622200-like [Triticum dicoccoides]
MQKMGKNCERCAEWQEHCYWSHMADENKHFFKLMAGDFAQSMSLPGRFAKNFNGRISEVINLKPHSGKSWSIEVAGDTDEVVLRSGWKEFVDDHGIGEGDRLLFRYSGASSFDVLMFDSAGCQKPPSPRPVKRRGCDDNDIAENSARAKGRRCGYHASNKAEERAPHPPSPAKGDGAGLEMTLYRGTGKSIARADHGDVDMNHGGAAAKNRYYFCKNGPVSEFHLTEEDKEEISSIPVPVEPRNPVFVNVMHASHVRGTTRTSIVGVSSDFAGKYLGGIGREIILRRAGGKGGWHVRYTSGDNCRGFCGRGWRDFARDNGLLAHDVCIFEFMEGARRPAANVHVLRRLHGRFVLVR